MWEEEETHTGLTWLCYDRLRTSLAPREGPTLDCQDKFHARVNQSLRHRVLSHVTPLRRRSLPFLPLGGRLGAKGDLLSIASQELLLDLGPLTSWP